MVNLVKIARDWIRTDRESPRAAGGSRVGKGWKSGDHHTIKEPLFQELTELRQRVSVLTKTVEQLNRSNKELSQVADVISHDLQEPLRTTNSYLEMLRDRCRAELGEEANELIDHAVAGSRRMSRMIQDLLALSKVRTRGRPFAATDCESVLSQALDNLRMVIGESGAVITHDPLPALEGDSRQLVQLFQNLIGNSIKFCAATSPRIHIGVRYAGGGYTFAVKDNGIGFEPRYADRIFHIFERLHGPEAYPGTGIGLALCRRVVERHGGRIWVDSLPGKGSTFYFTFPDAKPSRKSA
jgi:hypothetical protein